MARPLRIEYPGAIYHIMNRGADRRPIFPNGEDDRALFKFTLGEAVKKWKIAIHAYSLMDNHYHLLLETPLGNVSRAMRHIDGLYTQRLNKILHRDGPLFRGRFKSILVQKESYFLELVRYIHMNGVKAELYRSPAQDMNSSHPAYLNPRLAPAWLKTDVVLSYFQPSDAWQRQRLDIFVQKQIPEEILKVYRSRKWPAILGGDKFTEVIKAKYLKNPTKAHPEIPQKKSIVFNRLMDPKTIINVIDNYYAKHKDEEALGRKNRTRRWLTIYFLKEHTQKPYREIGLITGGRSARSIERYLKRNDFRQTRAFQELASCFIKMLNVET